MLVKGPHKDPLPGHLLPLSEFIGDAPVTNQTLDRNSIQKAWSGVQFRAQQNRHMEWTPHPDRPDLEYRKQDHYLEMRNTQTKEVVSGAHGSLVVRQDYAGKGLGAETQFVRTLDMNSFEASYYTRAGFLTMQATHRLHVTRAIEAGKDVPDEVLAQYDVNERGLYLKENYTAEMHGDFIRNRFITGASEVYQRISESHVAMAMRSDEYVTSICNSGLLDILCGYIFLRPVALTLGCPIVCALDGNRLLQVYLQVPTGYLTPFGSTGAGVPYIHPHELHAPYLPGNNAGRPLLGVAKTPQVQPPGSNRRFEIWVNDNEFYAALYHGAYGISQRDRQMVFEFRELDMRARRTSLPRRLTQMGAGY